MKHSDYQFSVVMAVYNVEKYIAEAVGSVINQTIGFQSNIQIVFVDDGSTDNSPEICDRYAALHTNRFFNVAPWHDLGSLYPAVVLFQLSSKWKEKLLYTKLIGIVFVVHKAPHIPGFCCYLPSFACLYYTTFPLFLGYFTSILCLSYAIN